MAGFDSGFLALTGSTAGFLASFLLGESILVQDLDAAAYLAPGKTFFLMAFLTSTEATETSASSESSSGESESFLFFELLFDFLGTGSCFFIFSSFSGLDTVVSF